jgi:hypothetical protein
VTQSTSANSAASTVSKPTTLNSTVQASDNAGQRNDNLPQDELTNSTPKTQKKDALTLAGAVSANQSTQTKSTEGQRAEDNNSKNTKRAAEKQNKSTLQR